MKIRRILLAAIFTVTGMLLPAAGFSYEFSPTLSIGLTGKYSDNIYLTNSDRKSDFITTISPGIDLSYKSMKTEVLLGYHPGFNYYASHSDKNYVSHALNFGALVKFSERLTLSVRDSFIKSEENQDIRTVYEGSLNQNVKRQINSLSGELGYKISPRLTSTLSGGYSDTKTSGSASETGNFESYFGGLSLSYMLSERTSVSANYKHTVFDYTSNDDSSSDAYTLGISYKLSETMTMALNGGISRTEYDDSGKSSTGFTGGASLTKRFERSNFVLAYNQGIMPNIENNDTTKTSTFSLKYSRRMTELLTAGANAFYAVHKSASGNNTDTREAGAGVSFSYMLSKAASLVLGYSYIKHDDKLTDMNDYRNHIAMLTFRYAYGMKMGN
ncbi:MAG: outer membrane beta-barrel protein [Nitrospirae bacterium]|nr:outer membrane beta-barrel protein [Nitrospirota bacterium]